MEMFLLHVLLFSFAENMFSISGQHFTTDFISLFHPRAYQHSAICCHSKYTFPSMYLFFGRNRKTLHLKL